MRLERGFSSTARGYKKLASEQKKWVHQSIGRRAVQYKDMLVKERLDAAESSRMQHKIAAGSGRFMRGAFARSVSLGVWEAGVRHPGARLLEYGGTIKPVNRNIFGFKRGVLFIPISDKGKKHGADAIGGRGLKFGVDFVFAKQARIRPYWYMRENTRNFETHWAKTAPGERKNFIMHNLRAAHG